jgi:predicted methyltransferase
LVYSATPAAGKELKERFQNPAFANVKLVEGSMDTVNLPTDHFFDLVLIHLNYHDLPSDVRTAMNRRVLAALKPGGTYGVVDHAAKDGSGNEFVKSLHRIDKALVIKEVTEAGFVLARESDLLRNPSDMHTETVFKIRGKTDRFVLSFQKPR